MCQKIDCVQTKAVKKMMLVSKHGLRSPKSYKEVGLADVC